MGKCSSVLALVLVVLLAGSAFALALPSRASAAALRAAQSGSSDQPGSGASYTAKIAPVIELLAGVQSQTDWMNECGPEQQGTEYFRALRAFFAPYKDDPAVRMSSDLLAAGFSWDAPVCFACHLGPLPDLNLEHEYSDYLVERAGGREKLEKFRLALKDLAEKSDFAEFVRQWQPLYDSWAAGAVFDGDRVIDWLDDFSGTAGDEYQMILAPAMFPGGGYGATVTTADGKQVVYQIVRDSSKGGDDQPVFPSGPNLVSLALHEWGHSFVNPAVLGYRAGMKVMRPYYSAVRRIVAEQAYDNVQTYACEQFLRAVTTLAKDEIYGPEAAEKSIKSHESYGFMLTRPIYETLKDYRASRDKYPTFASFLPEAYARLGKKSANRTPAIVMIAAPIVAAIAVTALMIARKGRARRPQS